MCLSALRRIKRQGVFFLSLLLFVFFWISPAQAQSAKQCMVATQAEFLCGTPQQAVCEEKIKKGNPCVWKPDAGEDGFCLLDSVAVQKICSSIKSVDVCTNPEATYVGFCEWKAPADAGKPTAGVTAGTGTIYQCGPPPGYNGPLPDCAFCGSCRDVGVFLELGIKGTQILFSFIGSIAFIMFVVGGFMMIFSFGNADRVKKGRDILIAAVLGMIIAFSAYFIVDFILDALQVGDAFRGVD